VHPDVTLAVGISRPTYTMAQDVGYAQILEKAGATLVNSCIGALNPFCFLEGNLRVAAATNSVRGAHYMQRMSGGVTKTLYGDIKKCVRAAVTRKWEA